MDENKIRSEIRNILKEFQSKFPYAEENGISVFPENIDTEDDYLINWNDASENNDLFEFPIEEFIKGINVEKSKKKIINIMNIAEIVINNLKHNLRFYSNLGV